MKFDLLMLLQRKNNYKIPNEYKVRLYSLFKSKKTLIHTILFLNTAFSLIDKMFQQEIINAELRKTHSVLFFINDLFTTCFPSCVTCCLPPAFIPPEETGGDIMKRLFGENIQNDIMEEQMIQSLSSHSTEGNINVERKEKQTKEKQTKEKRTKDKKERKKERKKDKKNSEKKNGQTKPQLYSARHSNNLFM